MCGLCIPHCPTYALSETENESPRGRIALMLGLARGQLEASPGVLSHLDHCLECRACEAVCPSAVPYGRLMDASRFALTDQGRRKAPRITRWMVGRLSAQPDRLRRWAGLLYYYQRSGLHALLRPLLPLLPRPLRRAYRLLPRLDRPTREIRTYPASTRVPLRGKVQLFRGCASRLFDARTQEAAATLLSRLGYVVDIPADQVCCGALAQHEGEAQLAQRLAQQNLDAFGHNDVPLLSTASGCSSQLREYNVLLGERADGLTRRAEDITAFLSRIPWPDDLLLRPLETRVAVHEPCLQRNVLKQASSAYDLLARIPGLEVVPLADNRFCCGAAGSQMLGQPEQAQALLSPKLDSARELQPELLVTTNIGCALHLQAGLREQGMDIEVIHPVTLLARQLPSA